jgi:hypothetical protein
MARGSAGRWAQQSLSSASDDPVVRTGAAGAAFLFAVESP